MMKRMMLAGAALAALISAPALAQQADQPPTDAATAEASAPLSGQVTVDGVEPSQALGAIDPTKLSGDSPDIAAPVADPDSASATTTGVDSTVEAEGNVTVQGVAPAQALGAIDPSQLAENKQGDETSPVADAASATAPEAPETYAEAATETAPQDGLVQVAEVDIPLPAEVAEVVEEGSYTTDDLVAAQLAAIMDARGQTAEAQPEPGSEPAIPPG